MSAQQAALSPDRPKHDAHPRDGQGDEHAGDSSGDDLSALRLVPVPDTGPPFDGDPLASAYREANSMGLANEQSAGNANEQGAGNAKLGAGTADVGGVQHGIGTPRLDASAEWAQQFARLLAEALAGARPLRQILPWTSERARVHLSRLTPLFRSGQRPRVLRVVANRPTRDVIEMCVIVGIGARTRALAVRLEEAAPYERSGPAEHAVRGSRATGDRPDATTSRWVCTDIEAA